MYKSVFFKKLLIFNDINVKISTKGGEEMAAIKMTPDEVRALSKTYSESSTEIQDMLSRLQSTQGQLAETWQGDAFQAFEEQFNQMKPTVEKFGQLMEDVYNQLNKIANIVQETDEKISSTVRGGF